MRIVFLIGLLALAVAGFGTAMTVAAPPPSPPGQDPCSHGRTGKTCREDPSTNGKDCEAHGNGPGGKNEDHCLPVTTTGTTGTTTGTTTTTPTTVTIDTQCIGCTNTTPTTGTTTPPPPPPPPPPGTTGTTSTGTTSTGTTPTGTTTAPSGGTGTTPPPGGGAGGSPPVVTPPGPDVRPPASAGQPPVVTGPNPPLIVTVRAPGSPPQRYRLYRKRYFPIVVGNG